VRIYYAHPISDYHTSYEEATVDRVVHALKFLTGKVPCIENPNLPIHQEGYHARGMDHFMDVIDRCDGCVFDSFPDGIIGSGVAMEVKRFLDQSKPVWQITGLLGLELIRQLPACVATRETTREMSKLYRAMPCGGRW
jgi:hypothetical protein